MEKNVRILGTLIHLDVSVPRLPCPYLLHPQLECCIPEPVVAEIMRDCNIRINLEVWRCTHSR